MDIRRLLESTIKTETTRTADFTGSGLPMCPVAYSLSRRLKNRIETYSFSSDLITEGGNFVHLVIQRWLGQAGLMFGRWKTLKGKRRHETEVFVPNNVKHGDDGYYEGCFGPIFNENGSPADYDEYRVTKGDFSGHIDAFLGLHDKKLIALGDIKTTSLRKMEEGKLATEDGDLAEEYHHYLLQLLSYYNCVKENIEAYKFPRGYKLAKFGYIIFVAREQIFSLTPNSFLIIKIPLEELTELWDDQLALYEKTKKLFEKENWIKLSNMKVCSSKESAGYCKYKYLCFSNNQDDLMRALARGSWL